MKLLMFTLLVGSILLDSAAIPAPPKPTPPPSKNDTQSGGDSLPSDDGGQGVNIGEYNEINFNFGGDGGDGGDGPEGVLGLIQDLIGGSDVEIGGNMDNLLARVLGFFGNGDDGGNEGGKRGGKDGKGVGGGDGRGGDSLDDLNPRSRRRMAINLIKQVIGRLSNGADRPGKGGNETIPGGNETLPGGNETETGGHGEKDAMLLQGLKQLLKMLRNQEVGKDEEEEEHEDYEKEPKFNLNINNDGFDLSVRRPGAKMDDDDDEEDYGKKKGRGGYDDEEESYEKEAWYERELRRKGRGDSDEDEDENGTGYTPFPKELREIPDNKYRDGILYGEKLEDDDHSEGGRGGQGGQGGRGGIGGQGGLFDIPGLGPIGGRGNPWYPNVVNSYVFYGPYTNINNVNSIVNQEGDDDDDDDDDEDDDKKDGEGKGEEAKSTTTAFGMGMTTPNPGMKETTPMNMNETNPMNMTTPSPSMNETEYFCINECGPGVPNGFYRKCNECDMHFMCVKEAGAAKLCQDLFFNHVTNQCDNKANVDCDAVVFLGFPINETTTVAPPPTTAPVMKTTAPVMKTTAPVMKTTPKGDGGDGGDDELYCVDFCFGVPDGVYPSCSQCSQYTKCFWGAAYKKYCKRNRSFDPSSKKCAKADHVECPVQAKGKKFW